MCYGVIVKEIMQMKKRFKRITTAAAATVSAIILASCGGQDAAPAAQQGVPETVAQQTAPETVAQQPVETIPVQTNTQTQQSAATFGTVSGEVKFENSWDGIPDLPPCIYYWSDSNTGMTQWPGDKLTNNGGTFSFSVPEAAEYISFNDGINAKTIDIPFDGSIRSYVVKDEFDSLGRYLVTDNTGNGISEKKAYSSTSNISSAQMKLSVEKAYATPGGFANSQKYITGGGDDALSFDIKNTGNGKATHIKLYVICFDKDGKTVHPSTGQMDNWSFDYETDLLALNTVTEGVAANSTETINYECGLNGTERCEAVIAEYVLDQVLYTNTDAAAWASQYIIAKH